MLKKPMTEEIRVRDLESGYTQQLAVIHIGATAVSMLVAEQMAKGRDDLVPLEVLERPLPLASDIFRSGRITQSTLERCVRILQLFQETLKDYGLNDFSVVRLVATNIILEADNVEVALNRIQVGCDVEVEPLDDGDMTRLIYVSGRLALEQADEVSDARALVCHAGPGNTRALVFDRNRVVQYASYRVGSQRVYHAVSPYKTSVSQNLELVQGHLQGRVDQILRDMGTTKFHAFVALGYEVQVAADFLKPKKSRSPEIRIKVKALRAFLESIAERTPEELVELLKIDYQTACGIPVGLEINLSIAEGFGIKEIRIPRQRFEEQLLGHLAAARLSISQIEGEVLNSALQLGRKYGIDIKHARQVEKLCLAIFDATLELHDLRANDRLLLRTAAILHEVGGFVSGKSHHKHSLYLIRNSEIFGLSEADTLLVGLVARYHRQAVPQMSHSFFKDLDRPRRIRVSKMVAILRVADAMEKGHGQRVRELHPRIERDQLVLNVGNLPDVKVEELALRTKGFYFTEVFGLDPVIETSQL